MSTDTFAVLLVEDNPGDAGLVAEYLDGCPFARFAITPVTSLADALAALASAPFDAVLLDLSLPDSHGIETVRRVAPACRAALLVLTGMGDEEMGLQALREGACDYLIKGQISGPLLTRALRYAAVRRQADSALRESEDRFRNAFDHAPGGMFLGAVAGRWLRVNPALCRIVGRTEAELLATCWQDITHPDDLGPDLASFRRLLAGEVPCYHLEKRYLRPDGEPIWVLLGAGIVRDAQGQPLYVVGHVQDISERKKASERLQESLAEKEVLLREVHHRVKNNLQVISSLLQLQAQHAGDGAAALLRESQGRVRSMALVHERLYRSRDVSRIDFAEYLRGLAASLVRTYQAAEGAVRLGLDLEPVTLSLDAAVPCGLLVNELLSNALKHAFPAGRPGQVSVSLSQPAAGQALLAVADDGVGLPDSVDVREPGTFGFRLITALAEQLHGVLEVRRRPGTAVRVRFPLHGPPAPGRRGGQPRQEAPHPLNGSRS